MFNKVLIANRGEIACRVIRAAKALGIKTVTIYSDADQHALHVNMADEAYGLGASEVGASYLNQDKIIAIAKQAGVEAIHPGYGLLSENAAFAAACEQEGIIFVGPKAATMAKLADKADAKALAQSLDIPVIDSIAVPEQVTDTWINSLDLQGVYIIKACAGGGGKGMRLITPDAQDIKTTIELAKAEAKNYFGDDSLILERYIKPARHIEVQILADQQGKTVHLFDRDCSLQRRYQKVIEEAPAPGIEQAVREQMYQAAIKLAQSVNYISAGTVEFLLDTQKNFYFLEMNTRVQVEHCVTEMITGIDIVQKQFEIAAGSPIQENQQDIKVNGASIEVRLCAEIPEQNFMPSVGLIAQLQWPQQDFVRVDAGYAKGNVLSPYYDSLLAKIIVHGNDRAQAVQHLRESMNSLYIEGIQTNQDWLASIIQQQSFLQDTLTTDYLDQYQVNKTSQFPAWLAPALIAIYQQCYAQPKVTNNLWHQSGGYSVIQKPQTHIVYQDDQAIAVTIKHKEPGLFAINQQGEHLADLQINQCSKNNLSFAWQNNTIQAHIFLSANCITVRLLGEVFQYQRYPISGGVTAGDQSGELTAPLPGSVVKVMVKQGNAVKKGDRLLVMEAMKMEHPLIAPFDGVVDKITAQEGDRVSLGDVLVIVS